MDELVQCAFLHRLEAGGFQARKEFYEVGKIVPQMDKRYKKATEIYGEKPEAPCGAREWHWPGFSLRKPDKH